MRAMSLDFDRIEKPGKLAKISKMLRSISDTATKKTSSSSAPSSPAGAGARRRFVRVVRNEEAEGEEYENPHLIRRYTSDYWEQQNSMRKSSSLEDTTSNKPLPYSVPAEQSILKKRSNGGRESPCDASSKAPNCHCNKRASFNENVQIIEFNKKLKIEKCTLAMHSERLSSDECESSENSPASAEDQIECAENKTAGTRCDSPNVEDADAENTTDCAYSSEELPNKENLATVFDENSSHDSELCDFKAHSFLNLMKIDVFARSSAKVCVGGS